MSGNGRGVERVVLVVLCIRRVLQVGYRLAVVVCMAETLKKLPMNRYPQVMLIKIVSVYGESWFRLGGCKFTV